MPRVLERCRPAFGRSLLLLRPGKFAEQLARLLRIGGVGGLRCWENAEMLGSPVLANSCAPSPSVSRNTLQSAGIVSISASIGIILRSVCDSQIDPTVV